MIHRLTAYSSFTYQTQWSGGASQVQSAVAKKVNVNEMPSGKGTRASRAGLHVQRIRCVNAADVPIKKSRESGPFR